MRKMDETPEDMKYEVYVKFRVKVVAESSSEAIRLAKWTITAGTRLDSSLISFDSLKSYPAGWPYDKIY